MAIISNCTSIVINKAATSLIKGNLVAFPTETVYGLGADAANKEAVARIYEVKGRPVGHPLIVHISSIEHLDKWAKDIPEYAIKLARNFWPGPMTLILPRTGLAKDFITGGQNNVGIRVPSHAVALELLKEFEDQGGVGVAAPSANRFGAVSPTSASAVDLELGAFLTPADQILDGGKCKVGIESTIIDCTNSSPLILRPGSITKSMVEHEIKIMTNYKANQNLKHTIKYSGIFKSHYAPKAKILITGKPQKGDGFLALNSIPTPQGVIRLAAPLNSEDFAHILYETFKKADMLNLERLFVVAPRGDGVEKAINDRLEKASNKNM
jgi:L-threonylcarbamoyladenylate synthase